MQRAAIVIRLAIVILAVSVVVPDRPRASVAPEREPLVVLHKPGAEDTNDVQVPVATPASPPRIVAAPLPPRRASMEEICATLHAAADAHALPLPFFARLIWQESRFRTDAVSRAGARGIAQFMPGTARERGLRDPHDPIQALQKSADFLNDLRNQFGNLGLAAAAYNGGPGRVQAWLSGRKGLPRETRDYVQIVTGVPADQWRGRAHADAVHTTRIPEKVPCPVLVAAAQAAEPIDIAGPVRDVSNTMVRAASAGGNWSVVIAGSFSKGKAESASAQLQRRFGPVLNGRKLRIVSRRVAGRGKARMAQVRISANDRAGAEQLCAKLRANGANCMVMRAS